MRHPLQASDETRADERVEETYDELRAYSSIEAEETLVLENLLSTVDAILVEHLADDCTTLILHSAKLSKSRHNRCLAETDRV